MSHINDIWSHWFFAAKLPVSFCDRNSFYRNRLLLFFVVACRLDRYLLSTAHGLRSGILPASVWR